MRLFELLKRAFQPSSTDVVTPVDQADIETLMANAASDQTKEPAFWRALLQGNLFTYEDDSRVPSEGRLSMRYSLDESGSPLYLIFTSEEALSRHTRESSAVVGLKAQALFDALVRLPKGRVFLNSGSDIAREVSWSDLLRLSDGKLPMQTGVDEATFPAGSELTVGVPATIPDGLAELLWEDADGDLSIQAVAFLLAERDSEWSYLALYDRSGSESINDVAERNSRKMDERGISVPYPLDFGFVSQAPMQEQGYIYKRGQPPLNVR